MSSDQFNVDGGLVPFDEACRLINRAPYTVREWARQGKVTIYKRGRDRFLDPAELRPQPAPRPQQRASRKALA